MNVIVNKNISIKAFVIITIFTILIGLAMIYIATKGFINVNILKNYKKEIAKINYSMIVDTDHRGSEHSTYHRKVRYSYFVDNQQYEGQYILWWRFLFNQEYKIKEVFDEKSKPLEEKLKDIFISFLIEKINK